MTEQSKNARIGANFKNAERQLQCYTCPILVTFIVHMTYSIDDVSTIRLSKQQRREIIRIPVIAVATSLLQTINRSPHRLVTCHRVSLI